MFSQNQKRYFAALQSTIHDVWCRRYGKFFKTDLRYNPSDCFETFPLPVDCNSLEDVGANYYHYRRSLMFNQKGGLTKTYNRFHDPKDTAADIVKMRALHMEMDLLMARTYGWHDLCLGHEFRSTRQGVRYTISESACRIVLDRLLILNHEHYQKEIEFGLQDKKVKKSVSKRQPVSPRLNPVEGDRELRFEDAPPTLPTPKATPAQVLVLPSGKRFPVTIPNLYARNLIAALLNVGGEDGLPWPLLRDAFVLATNTALLRQFASEEDASLASAWEARWNEVATPNLLLPVLKQMGSRNLAVKMTPEGPRFIMKQHGKLTFSAEVSFDAQFALKVASTFALDAPPPLPESVEWIAAAREIALAI